LFISIFTELGLDFTGIDLEHGRMSPLDSHAVDYSVVEAADISLEVGSTSGDRGVVGKVLDTGSRTVCITRGEPPGGPRTADGHRYG